MLWGEDGPFTELIHAHFFRVKINPRDIKIIDFFNLQQGSRINKKTMTNSEYKQIPIDTIKGSNGFVMTPSILRVLNPSS